MSIVIPINEKHFSNEKRLPRSYHLRDFNVSADPEIVGKPNEAIVSDTAIKERFFKAVKNAGDSQIVIPDEYAQFTKIISAAVNHHYHKGYATDDCCALQIEQLTVPKESRLKGKSIHVDGYHVREGDEHRFMGEDNYLATSSLSPMFFNNRASSDKEANLIQQHINNAKDVTERSNIIHRFLETKYGGIESGTSYGDHTLINFDGIKPHISAQAKEDTLKTLVIVRFSPS